MLVDCTIVCIKKDLNINRNWDLIIFVYTSQEWKGKGKIWTYPGDDFQRAVSINRQQISNLNSQVANKQELHAQKSSQYVPLLTFITVALMHLCSNIVPAILVFDGTYIFCPLTVWRHQLNTVTIKKLARPQSSLLCSLCFRFSTT